jgi:hypothetical protein
MPFDGGPDKFLGQAHHRLVSKTKIGRRPTHGVWKESDDTVFKKTPKEKQQAWLTERRAEITEKLNRDCKR